MQFIPLPLDDYQLKSGRKCQNHNYIEGFSNLINHKNEIQKKKFLTASIKVSFANSIFAALMEVIQLG